MQTICYQSYNETALNANTLLVGNNLAKRHCSSIMQTNSFQKFRVDLGERIQGIRKCHGYSQEQIAAMLDMDRVSIGYIEQGRRTPKLSTLYKMSELLQIPLKDLLPD
jgi:DNA-binding XRE family transcriptional regulator